MSKAAGRKRKLSRSESEGQTSTSEVEKDEQNLPENRVEPAHSLKIRFKLRKLIIRIHLHRVPDTAINVFATEKEFTLDTFKFTKKFYLKLQYPRNIQVDPNNSETTFEHGILQITFPITQIKDNETGQVIRKKGAKRQKTESTQPSSTAPGVPSAPVGKSFADKDKELSLIDTINDVEDEKRQKKIDHQLSKEQFLQQKEQDKQNKKQKKEKLRQKAIQEVKETNKDKEQDVPQTTQNNKKNKKQKQNNNKKEEQSEKSEMDEDRSEPNNNNDDDMNDDDQKPKKSNLKQSREENVPKKRKVSFSDTVQVKEFDPQESNGDPQPKKNKKKQKKK
eukprot:TRINITY_DN1507_c0_g2_i1.p1 TRINITY_DN1507_c0_g2~~TRINITY_DN1507_c0_g2_i1.p1  ORF type:complete len:335 (-),score=134.93 TRINITY_DN1507_c0_g2_i1:312-1316(-)